MNDSRDEKWKEAGLKVELKTEPEAGQNAGQKADSASKTVPAEELCDRTVKQLQKECVHYFRERPIFDRLLKGFREKYLSYGSFSGTVLLRNLQESEREDLEGFLRKNYHGKKSATVSAAHFRKALSESRFGRIMPDELLRLYFREELTGKKEQKLAERQAREAVFEQMREKYAGTPAGEWICAVTSVDRESTLSEDDYCMDESAAKRIRSWLMKKYRENDRNPDVLLRNLELGAEMINQFPCRTGVREYLAVFAARLTGNPHAFDDGSRDGQLLTLTVLWENERQEVKKQKSGDQISSTVFPVIGKQKQYLAVGILKDDMSNYAMLSGIRARKKDGSLHAGIEGFLSEGEPVQVPLSVIAGWEQVECPDNTIYIVENPSVYALLCQRWLGKRACMCMNGQPRLSAVLILDLLAKSNATVYYAGDFDPEGLLIAQKIRQYYLESLAKNILIYSLPDNSASGIKQKFHFWHMSGEDCHASLSEEPISEKRMKMLDRITDQELAHAVRLLREYGVAGYQENIYDRYQE